MLIDPWIAETLLREGTRYIPHRNSDGKLTASQLAKHMLGMLRDAAKYSPDIEQFRKAVAQAQAQVAKLDPEDWTQVTRALMQLLYNGRAASGVPYPCTPDNLTPLHGKRCWKNVQKYSKCPSRIRLNFTGGIIPEYVFVYVYDEDSSQWTLDGTAPEADGTLRVPHLVGKQVTVIRDIPALAFAAPAPTKHTQPLSLIHI